MPDIIPQLPVPIPDRIAALIGSRIPIHVLQAEVDAESASREVRRFRPSFGALLDDEDRADRDAALSELAAANKILAAHHPRLILTPKRGGRS